MRKLTSILIVGLTLTGSLTACAPAPSNAAQALPESRSASALPTPLPTAEPAGVGVLAVVYTNDLAQLTVVSSMTGKVLEAFTPIPLGSFYGYAFAPDGHTLAVVSIGHLYLIDLPSWKTRSFDSGLHGSTSAIVYSPDGTLLAMAGGEPDATLRIVDAKSGQIKVEAQAGFAVHNLMFTRDGKAIMLYGPRLADKGQAANMGVSIGSPKAELLSAADLKPLWSVDLTGIRDGTFPKDPNATDIYQPGSAWHFSPAIAFAPNADILYAVHGDADKLTTINFAKRQLSTVSLRLKTGWLDRLLAMTAGVAHAKGMDGTTKQGVISPDGKYFYVVGSTETVTKQASGNEWNMNLTYIGLQVIDVQDGVLEQKIDSDAYSARLSSDGKRLFLTGWEEDLRPGGPWTDIYDTGSRSIAQHLNGVQLVPTHRLDGGAILQSSIMISDRVCDLASIDPDTWAVTNSWRGPVCADWLIVP